MPGFFFVWHWLGVAFESLFLMFLVGLLAWGVACWLEQPLARWVVAVTALVVLVCVHGWDVWFQSDPKTWIQHLERRDGPTLEQQAKLIWAAFWGGIVGLFLSWVAEHVYFNYRHRW